MPLQNRVTPFGSIIADPARGTVMGNRGRLHDEQRTIFRPYETTRWIICKLDFKGRRREPMPPNAYTSLFFLDEVTALAAGHRPCFECNHEHAQPFVQHWSVANPIRTSTEQVYPVDLMDAQLHADRLTNTYYLADRRKRVYLDVIDSLPDGTFVALGDTLDPFLVRGSQLFPWRIEGYSAPIARPIGRMVVVITPASTVRALSHGYRPAIHDSAVSKH